MFDLRRPIRRSPLNRPRLLSALLAVAAAACGGGGEDTRPERAALEESDGWAAFQSGRLYAEQGDHDRAAAEFQNAIKLDPLQADFYYDFGLSLVALGMDTYARQALLRGLDLKPRHAGMLKEMGSLAARSNRHDESVNFLRRSLEIDDTQADVHCWLGCSLIYLSDARMGSLLRDQERLDEGLASLQRAIDLDPEEAEYHYWLAKAWEAKNDQEKALASFEKAAELDPKNVNAQLGVGALRGIRGEFAAARVAIERALALAPEDQKVMYEYGLLLEQEGDLEKAREAYEGAIGQNPTTPEPHFRLANVLSQLGDEEGHLRATAEFERWSELNNEYQFWHGESKTSPGDPEVLANFGEMQFLLNQQERALGTFGSVLQIDPENVLAHYYSGQILQQEGELGQAVFHLAKAAELDPDKLAIRRALAGAQLAQGDRDGARGTLEGILAAENDDSATAYNLGVLDIQEGELERATERFQRALELAPDYVEARYALAGVYYAREMWKEAADEYQRILEVQPDNEDAQHFLELARNEGKE